MRARVLVSLSGLAALAVAVCFGTTAVATAPLASAPAAAASSGIHPMIAGHLFASRNQPLTTAQCRAKFHVSCYEPFQLERAYNLLPLYKRGYTGAGRTIVIIDSFGSPTIRNDLAVFDQAFGLPAPPHFTIVQPDGPNPRGQHAGWAGETNLDVEWSHAIAPGANIVLVETPVSETEGTHGFPQVQAAVEYIVHHHLGDVISQSFSATEQTFPSFASLSALRTGYIDAAQHGITVLAASGDSGAADVNSSFRYYPFPVTSWPDSDPLVTGVGGTQLHLNAAGNATAPPSVWNDTYSVATNKFIFGDNGPNPLAGGGGKSVLFGRPSYQDGVERVVGTQRGVPDIAMSGACNGGVDTYQSFKGQPAGWYEVCGTSEATPEFAGIVAIAAQYAGHGLGVINPALYQLSAEGAPGIVDVTKGNNTVTYTQSGTTTKIDGFRATRGYDLASGVGTVDAAKLVPELAAASG